MLLPTLFTYAAFAQVPDREPLDPFRGESGVVFVTSKGPLWKLEGANATSDDLLVQAVRRQTAQGEGAVFLGVNIWTRPSAQSRRTRGGFTYVDHRDVTAILKGLEYCAAFDYHATPLEQAECSFSLNDTVRIVLHDDNDADDDEPDINGWLHVQGEHSIHRGEVRLWSDEVVALQEFLAAAQAQLDAVE